MKRRAVWLLPTLVTDRFGNWVRYTYDPAIAGKLISITASDGREVTLRYEHPEDRNLITSVSDGTRTWRYGYTSYWTNGGTHFTLDSVTLPDGSSWQLGGIYPIIFQMGVAPRGDCNPKFTPGAAAVGTMTHPAGAVGSFSMKGETHGRSDVPFDCYLTGSGGRYNPRAVLFYTLSLNSKTITGPGLDPMTWSYNYGPPNGSWAPCGEGCPTTKTVLVTNPKGEVTRYVFGNRYRVSEGMLEQVDYGWNGVTALRTTQTRYRPAGAGPYPDYAGYAGEGFTDGETDARFRPADQVVTIQQGETFTWTAEEFDDMARPLKVTRASSLGYARTESTVYEDNLGNWVLGQVEQVADHGSGKVLVLNEFNPVTANVERITRFGKLERVMTYHGDGSLASVTDGRNYVRKYDDYKRGLPRRITYPDGGWESAIVDNIGLVRSVTRKISAGGATATTELDYDGMGRLAEIRHPTGDSVAWNPVRLQFHQIWETEYGLPPGHWRQIVTVGSAIEVNYLDALWRPVFIERWDQSERDATNRFVERRYDFAGRTIYESYPRFNFWFDQAGIHQEYDAIGRPTVRMTISEHGPLYDGYAYLAGFRKVYTDAKGHDSYYTYQAFDQPAEEAISTISMPEGVFVSIARDLFGKPLSITRGGGGQSATRSYAYDQHERLCKTIEPETLATLVDYDGAGNVAWRATGLNLLSKTCDRALVPEARKTSYQYDARDRLTRTTYGDGSPGIWRTYTPDGMLESTESNGTKWTYAYDKRRLPETESLAYGGVTYQITRHYDGNGALAALTYPDNLKVNYSPDAFGDARQAGFYATSIKYHPNGAIKSFTYGNGLRHTLTQNLRGLPELATDEGVLIDKYEYDKNANVGLITDKLEGISTRTMHHDGLNRLKEVQSPLWGTVWYSYDALDNLVWTHFTGGGTARATKHQYDPARNTLTSVQNLLGADYNIGYLYDDQGNVKQRAAQQFEFDMANRLKRAVGKGTYVYDGHGRRVSSVGSDGVNRITVYGLDGKLLYMTVTGTPLVNGHKYVYLHNHAVALVGGAATAVSYVHTDGLGSPVAMTDATRKIVSRTRYEPYGAAAAGTAGGIGFGGHVNAGDLGLVYMQQRFYDPVAGRFLSVDPVVTDANTGGSFNRYTYAANNPYRYVDPDGRAVESVTMDKNKNVHIVVGMSYKGAVTPKQAEAFNKAIVNAYSGKKGQYAVNVTIIPSEQAKLGNYVTVVDGTKGSETSGIGARETTLYTNDPAGATKEQVVVHEFGHLVGARDQYYSDGTAKPGYENNVMGNAKSGVVDERTINEILERNPPKEPRRE